MSEKAQNELENLPKLRAMLAAERAIMPPPEPARSSEDRSSPETCSAAKLRAEYDAAVERYYDTGYWQDHEACIFLFDDLTKALRAERPPNDVVSLTGLLAEALRAVMELVNDGDLVRNTEGDDDLTTYARQAMKITSALKKVQAALASANDQDQVRSAGRSASGKDL